MCNKLKCFISNSQIKCTSFSLNRRDVFVNLQALEVAGQVVGTPVSTSPLSYSMMAGQCEALETGTRKKLSNWLAQENSASGDVFSFPSDGPTTSNPVSAFNLSRSLSKYLLLSLPAY